MAILTDILNLVQSGLGAVLGTGTKGGKPFFKNATTVWFTPQGFKYDGSVALDETYAKQLQAEGKLIILKGIETFTDNSSDDTIETLDSGTKNVANTGLYEFMLEFMNGLFFHAALHSLNSFGEYDALFIDRDGNMLGTLASDGSLKGFSVGMLQARKFTFGTNSTTQKEGLDMQLLERNELDKDYVFIQRKQLTFDANKLDGVNEVELSYSIAPADLAVLLTVKAIIKQNKAPFTGAAFGDFLLKVDGATANPTAGDDSVLAGTYPLTVAALATNEALDISLYNNVDNRPAIDVDGDLYKSNNLLATVI